MINDNPMIKEADSFMQQLKNNLIVKKYVPYTIDYDIDTSVKRIKTWRDDTVSNTSHVITGEY